jgi:multiple sugar transport system substrate-binding protein
MWHSGIWMFGAAAKSSFAWDIAVEPGDVANASAVFSNAVVVSSSSTHKEAAQKFAEFVTSSQVMVDTRLSAGWELPAISDTKLLATYLDKGTPANRQAVFDSLDGIALPPVIGANQTQMQDIITAQLTEAASGRMSVEDALASAAKQINGLLG